MRDTIGDYFDGEALRIADRLFALLAITHDPRQFDNVGDPAAIGFAIQFDGEVHVPMIARHWETPNAAGGRLSLWNRYGH